MSEIIKAPSTQLGERNLQTLDELYTKYTGLVSKAKDNYNAAIAPLAYGPDTKEKMDNFVQIVKTRKKELNEARAPYTKAFDEIKKLFTEMEKEYDVLVANVDQKVAQWKREELARQQQQQAQRAAQAKLEAAKTTIMPVINRRLTDWVHEQKLQFLEAIAAGQQGPIVKMDDAAWQAICGSSVQEIGATEFVKELGTEVVKPQKEALWKKTDDDLANFRFMANKQYREGGVDSIQQLQKTLGVVFAEEVKKVEEAAEAAQDEAVINQAIAETPIQAGPVIQTKMIANPVNTDEMLRVFNYFIQWKKGEDGEAETLAWMKKNLSAAITQATRDRNKNGTEIKGVTYIEDVK